MARVGLSRGRKGRIETLDHVDYVFWWTLERDREDVAPYYDE